MRRSGFCLFVISLLGGAEAARSAEFNSFGDLPGRGFLRIYDISADGSVVVGRTNSDHALGEVEIEAFRWSLEEGLTLLGGERSIAFGVSANGTVIVGASITEIGTRAFRWTATLGMEELETFEEASVAMDISDDGSVVVGYGGTEGPGGGLQAIRWIEGEGVEVLGDLPGGDFHSRARGISNDGTTIVGFATPSPQSEAMRWTEADGMHAIGALPGAASQVAREFVSIANATSEDGSVVVGRSDSAAGLQAFRWTEATGIRGLTETDPSVNHSEALDVSADGSVVVGFATRGDGLEATTSAFIWDETHGLRDLQEVLTRDFGLDLKGFRLGQADAVSADGKVIVGLGVDRRGENMSWIAVIPEPASWSLLCGGAACLLLLRKQYCIRRDHCN